MLLRIYLAGLVVLAVAVLLNMAAKRLNLKSWYDLLQKKSALRSVDYLWLFLLYPLGLGLAAYVARAFI